MSDTITYCVDTFEHDDISGCYTVPVCQEDEPCWDCTTMGNMQCGPTTTAVVAVAEPPVPYLPDTGTASGGIAAIGSILIFLGLGLTLTARRNK